MDPGAVHQRLVPCGQWLGHAAAHTSRAAPDVRGPESPHSSAAVDGRRPAGRGGMWPRTGGLLPTSDLVATHGSGLRRYVLIERPKDRLVQRDQAC
jgi:hypothetical protein